MLRRTLLLPLLVALTAVAAEVKSPPLKLKDGRSLAEWSILSETATSVFVRYKGGGAKVEKKLLPPDVLAAHPIDEEGAKKERAALEEAARKGEVLKAEAKAAREKEYTERTAKAAKEIAAKEQRQAEHAAAVAAAAAKQGTIAVNLTPVTPTAEPDEDPAARAVRRYAENYFRYKLPAGSSHIRPTGVTIEIEHVEPVAGWRDRFRVTGTGFLEYRDVGGDQSRTAREFTADLDRGRVQEFSVK